MAEFIRDYSIVAHKRETSAIQGVMVDYPAYILVFLIHVLALNNDLPFDVCPDEKIYADVCRYIVIIILHILVLIIVAYEYTTLYGDASWLLLCSPLFFVLQALVDINIVDGDVDIVDGAVLHIVSIFRAIRKAEDAVDAQMTTVKFFDPVLH